MPDNKEFHHKLQALKSDYKDQLPDRLRHITDDWDTLCDVTWNDRLLDRLITRVHNIAGSGGSFGFTELSRQCKTVEHLLIELKQQKSLPSVPMKRHLSTLIETLYEYTGLENDAPLIVERDTALDMKLLIVDDDRDYAQLMAMVCEQWGCETDTLDSISLLEERLARSLPEAVLIDIVFPEGGFAGIDAVKKIHDSLGLKIPVIFMSARNDLDARLKAMRAGGEAYLTKPVDPVELKSLLERLRIQKSNYASVLIVDDDEIMTRTYSFMLSDFGFETFSCNDPTNVIRMVEKHAPNLVLLDLNMPRLRGDELIRIFKQDPKYMHIPLVMMTADAREETRLRALEAGAADFIVKPFEADELAIKVRDVIVRNNAMQQLIKQVTKEDLSKNISNRQHFISVLQEVLTTGELHSEPAVLVQLTTRNLEYIRHRIGLSKMDHSNNRLTASIRQNLQSGELMTDVSDLTVLLLLKGHSLALTQQRVQSILEKLNSVTFNSSAEPVRLDCCAGIYTVSRTSRHIDEILNEVEHAAFTATTTPGKAIVVCNTRKESLASGHYDRDVDSAVENQRIDLTYQPIINMNRREPMYEGYARIRDDSGVPLMPSEFMSYIDNKGIQNEFNEALTYSALQQLNDQAAGGVSDFKLIIKLICENFSPLNYLSWLGKVISNTATDSSHRLLISIPESYAFRQQQAAIRLITGIRDLRCGLVMDRAGATDHSIAITQELQPDYLKIDRPIIEQVVKGEPVARRRLKELAGTDVPVIAPYVETAASFACLWDLGVRHFQGFFVQAPRAELDFDFSQQ